MHNGFEDLGLDRLRRRRSEKWQLHPPDVLPAFIAEMDYDLAEPVAAALRAAVDLGDCGYAARAGLGETFAAFAAGARGYLLCNPHNPTGRVFSAPAEVFLDRGRVALGRGLNFGAPGDGFVRVTIGTSSALLAAIVDRMAAAV